MTHVRRLTLQLTPLLDLLLIVMFAQYLQLRIAATQEADRFASEREASVRENEELRRQVDLWESQQQDSNNQQQTERIQLGQLLRELFLIPEATINKIIQPRSKNESGGMASSEIADLKSQFQRLSTARGDQVVDHLLTYNEMRKQFDIWEIYMNDDGELLITVGQDRQTLKSKSVESPEAFVDIVLKVRKQVPPSKSTVLILCRYGDCRLLNQLAMTRGLPAIAERLKGDGQGSTRFEYAVLGFRPHPEIDKR